tara:strand:+ start:538 stop:705 length:168 start_codon:yes stop_codon:yes gene_type:complete
VGCARHLNPEAPALNLEVIASRLDRIDRSQPSLRPHVRLGDLRDPTRIHTASKAI